VDPAFGPPLIKKEVQIQNRRDWECPPRLLHFSVFIFYAVFSTQSNARSLPKVSCYLSRYSGDAQASNSPKHSKVARNLSPIIKRTLYWREWGSVLCSGVDLLWGGTMPRICRRQNATSLEGAVRAGAEDTPPLPAILRADFQIGSRFLPDVFVFFF
jgi:hypothetical protein